jgi:hypothetical protein
LCLVKQADVAECSPGRLSDQDLKSFQDRPQPIIFAFWVFESAMHLPGRAVPDFYDLIVGDTA